MKVAMFRPDYAGTVTAACLAWHGRSPVAEPVLDRLTAQAVGGTLHATTSRLDAVDRIDVSRAHSA